jgi:hypothetical protein
MALLTWLEVAKVLLSQSRLFINLDVVALKRRRSRIVVRRESSENAFRRLARPPIRRCEDANGVVLAQHGLEPAPSVLGLQPPLWRQADAVIGYELVNVPVAVAFRLAVADKNEQLGALAGNARASAQLLTLGFPMVASPLVLGHSRQARWNPRVFAQY